jgi:diguanylate cyclase (GGDEF)-like protein
VALVGLILMKKKPKRSVPKRGPATGRFQPSGTEPSAAEPGAKAIAKRVASPQATIRRLKSQLRAALSEIEALRASADTDYLLGVLNRRGFTREFNRALAYFKRYRATGALIMIDVDRLKPINDGYGHAAGDTVLKVVTDTLLQHVRASDLIGRLGGDEFALLLWHLNEADARTKAAALEAAIDGLSVRYGEHDIATGISAGVAMLTMDSEADDALAAADHAMYIRKAERRAALRAAVAVKR